MKRTTALNVRSVALALLGLLGATPGVFGQASSDTSSGFDDLLFPPELIMQHRRAIDLTDEQRDAITGLIQNLQSRLVRLQWDLLDKMEEFTETIERQRVDLDQAMDQLNAALELEKRIKERHLELLIRIKNLLSLDQQAQLQALREPRSGPPDQS